MIDITNLSTEVQSSQMYTAPARKPSSEGDSSSGVAASAPAADLAEFSELGQLMSLAKDMPDVREQKIAEVRAAIDHDVDAFIRQRLDGTVDRLVQDLLGE